ncbi:MAG: cytochrome C [Methylovirgula sp.]
MQTGQPCSACHTAFPELTPYGREFKLMGYTAGGGLGFPKAPPVAAMVVPTFTHTEQNQDSPPTPDTYSNNNTVLQQASLFYGGQIYGDLGAFVQGTYDRATQHVFLDNTDIRYAHAAQVFGINFIYGVDVNNNPTVQDVWNTTPAWSFPYLAATLAPQFGPPATMIEGGFAGQVVGAGVYMWWHDMVYAEISGYRSLSVSALQALGEPGAIGSTAIDGVAPYWRFAIAPTFGEHSFMIGTFGMAANEIPGRVYGFGTDQIVDIGFDAQYQFIHGKHAFEAKLSDIHEFAQYDSSFAQGAVANPTGNLNTFHGTVDYVFDNTYSFTASYFNVTGSNDAVLYANSLTGSPNSDGLIFDVAYLPFSHGGPSFFPWVNARIGVSYTKYLTLYGGSTNFDGLGHNASDNNTLLTYAWVAF